MRKKIFLFTCYYIVFLYVLKTKANNSQSTPWCPLKISLSCIAFSDVILENRVYLTSTVSTNRANHLNVTSIYPKSKSNIRRSVVSIIVMRMDEESRRTSVTSFSMQTLTVSGPKLIKLSLYSKHLVNIPSLLVKTLPGFERQQQCPRWSPRTIFT